MYTFKSVKEFYMAMHLESIDKEIDIEEMMERHIESLQLGEYKLVNMPYIQENSHIVGVDESSGRTIILFVIDGFDGIYGLDIENLKSMIHQTGTKYPIKFYYPNAWVGPLEEYRIDTNNSNLNLLVTKSMKNYFGTNINLYQLMLENIM